MWMYVWHAEAANWMYGGWYEGLDSAGLITFLFSIYLNGASKVIATFVNFNVNIM